MEIAKGVDVKKRTVTTNFCNLLLGIRSGHNILLLATSGPKLRFVTIACQFQIFSLRFSC